jgi:hypothetical protein
MVQAQPLLVLPIYASDNQSGRTISFESIIPTIA